MNDIPEVCETPGCDKPPVKLVNWQGFTFNCEEHANGIANIARHLNEYPIVTDIIGLENEENKR